MVIGKPWTYRLLVGVALMLAPMVPAGCGDDDGGTGGGTGEVGGGTGGGTVGDGGTGGGTANDGGPVDTDAAVVDTSMCTGGVDDVEMTCTITCTNGASSCTGPYVCPEGYSCTLTCSGNNGCTDVVLHCADPDVSCTCAGLQAADCLCEGDGCVVP